MKLKAEFLRKILYKSKMHTGLSGVHFSKGIFMKKFLRKDTYIIPIYSLYVNSIF